MRQALPDSIRPVKLSDSRELVRLHMLNGPVRAVREQIRNWKQNGPAYCLTCPDPATDPQVGADGQDGSDGQDGRRLAAFAAFSRTDDPDIVRLSLHLPGDAAAIDAADDAAAAAAGDAASDSASDDVTGDAAVASDAADGAASDAVPGGAGDDVSGDAAGAAGTAAGEPLSKGRPAGLADDLRALAHHLFVHASVHRIEWLVPADRPFLLSLADALGFRREGRLRSAVRSGAVYHDGFLYSLLRWENPLVQWGFVDFGWFLAGVFGSADVVQEIRLVPYGSRPENPGLRDGLAGLGLLDAQGIVCRRPADNGLSAAGLYDVGGIPDALNTAGMIAAGGSADGLNAAGVGAVFLQSGLPAEGALGQGCRELSEYVLGRRTQFETPLDPAAGSPFSRRVWALLRQIPFGQIRQYEDIAADLIAGDETAAQKQISARHYARAVGAACGANPFLIMVPCHRVLGKGGKLTGFSAGIRHKAELLDYEIMGQRPSDR